MSSKIYHNLYIGNLEDCSSYYDSEYAIVHACKSPCHQQALRYSRNLPKTHPNYLVLEQTRHLFLNLIDSRKPLYLLPLFTEMLDFIHKHIKFDKVLIHCNQGMSRAPSLGILYLAKRTNILNTSSNSYESAVTQFKILHPTISYYPNLGIRTWLSNHWKEIE